MKCKSKYPIRIKERREVKSNYRSYFLDEFEIFDGESFVKFNLIDINHEKNEITVFDRVLAGNQSVFGFFAGWRCRVISEQLFSACKHDFNARYFPER